MSDSMRPKEGDWIPPCMNDVAPGPHRFAPRRCVYCGNPERDDSVPAVPSSPTPEASTKEPCKVHVDALPQRPGEQFQRCKVCGIEVGPSGAGGGSWVAIDRATYGKVTTWKNGVLQKPTPEAGAE